MTDEQLMAEEATIDLKDVIRVVKKRRRLIIGVFLAATIGAAVISLFLPKTYETETTLRIQQPKGLGDSLLGSMPMVNTLGTQQTMSTYAEILKSRTVVEKMIGRAYKGYDPKKIPDYEDMLGQISTLPVKNTEILNVSVQDNDPAQAQRVANVLVQTFIERMTYLSRSEQASIREFIGTRLRDSKKELNRAEIKLEEYKRNQKIVAPEEESNAIITQLSAINQLKAENSVNLAASQAKLASANKQLKSEKPGFIAENQLITQYRGKLADLEVQLVGLLQKYTENHPEVKAVRASIAETKASLNAEIKRVINNEASSLNPVYQGVLQNKIQSEAEIAAANSQKTALDRVIAGQEDLLTTLPAKERGFVRATRDVEVAQQIYTMLAQRYEEARISEVMQPTDVQVIDEAFKPEADKPIKPKKRMNVMIGAFLGLCAGFGLAFFLEYFNKTITNSDDVQYYLGLPVLGQIPEFDQNSKKKSGIFGLGGRHAG